MVRIVKTEFYILKRYHILWAGVAFSAKEISKPGNPTIISAMIVNRLHISPKIIDNTPHTINFPVSSFLKEIGTVRIFFNVSSVCSREIIYPAIRLIHIGINMVRIVKTEFYKLKRYHILWAGVALMLLSVLLTLFTSMANDGSVWDFAYLTEQVIKNNMSMIFPMCISLIAGYMISREQTDDTLKNILTVPISFKKLLTGKLIVCGVLSIIFGLICSLFTIISEMIVGFPGFEISLALKATLQITAVNFFLYLAVLPIIALTCRKAGSFLVGVIIAFVYGYGGMFAAGNMTLANLYPITASLGMVGYRSYDTAVNWNIGTCSCSLVLAVVISAILILCMKEREATQTKKKAKKVAPKKGW